VSVSAQGGQTPPQTPQTPTGAAQQVRRLAVEDAVRLAAENNLGLTIARINPLLEDLDIDQVQTAWSPSLSSTFSSNRRVNQNTGFLSGAAGDKTTDSQFNTDVGVVQTLPWGGNYSMGWTTARSTTNNVLSNFSPQLRSGLSLGYTQPLLRNFRIDSTRQQLLVAQKQREIADVQLRQTLASTSRTVRNAYWDLAYARAFLQVQQQSLELARESLRNTRARIEIGTEPPIEEIGPEAEVAQLEEAVITAESQIATAEDRLRTLIFNPTDQAFWNVTIEPSELPSFTPVTVDSEAAIRNALDRRSDIQQSRKALEQSDISLRFQRNQTLPEITADFDYSVSGIGGTQLRRESPFGGAIIETSQRSFGSVVGDLFSNDFPTWTAGVTVRYPLGRSAQDAALARTRLQYNQLQTQMRQQQMQVTLEVRQAARQVETNQKRVETTRRAREFAERRLDAEQRKLAAGTSTNFVVLQVQRDLAQARNTELNAILDYQRSVVDLDTVQEIPLSGGGGVTAVTTGGGGGGGATGAAAP
jgi:HAE1 family hydrophobic/amphiphilic exporter-1